MADHTSGASRIRHWFSPSSPPPPPPQQRSQPGEFLFEVFREHDQTRWLCELRQHPEPYGVEAQFFVNDEFIQSRRFDQSMNLERTPRAMAIAWAEEERKTLEED